LKSDHIEECPVGVQIDEEVDVALGRLLSASDGSKDSKISDSMAPGGRLEPVA